MISKLLGLIVDPIDLYPDMRKNPHRYATGPWQVWFAWYPRIHENKIIWLTRIFRRRVEIKPIGVRTYQYSTLLEYLKNI